MRKIQKIAIIRLSSIGDIILTTALIRCVYNKYPDAKISFIVKSAFYDLLKYNPHISEIITFDKNTGFKGLLELRKKIKKQKFDWFIDIHNNIRSNILKRGIGISLKTRYHKRIFKRTMLVKLNINRYPDTKLVLLRYFEAAGKMNVSYDQKGTDVLFSEKEALKVSSFLKSAGYDESKIAVICPGASYKNKQWLITGFTEVTGFLLDQNYQVVLLGGKNDFDTCQEINELGKFNCLNLAGKMSLLESAALLKHSKITITNDSGMMHMAQSQNSPIVAIFGPTTKELGYFPMPENSEVVEIDVPCRPCTHKGLNHCPKGHFQCMKNINSEMVVQKIRKFM